MKARLTRCSNQFGSCLFFVLLVSTTPAQATEPTQDASKGILDLRQANLDDATEIRLGGEWRVFWKQLVSEFLPNSPSAEYVAVPRLWNRPSNTQNFIRPEQGVTTLQLTVFLPESLPKSWHNGIHVNNGQVISASQLTIYDDATHEVLGRLKSGKVSADPNLHQAGFVRESLQLLNPPRKLRFVLEISNYDSFWWGVWRTPTIGSLRNLPKLTAKREHLDFFVTGIGLIMALYHLILYLLRRREKTPLWFALICITLTFRTLYIQGYLPTNPWWLHYKLWSLALYGVFVAFILFIQSLFPNDLPAKATKHLLNVFRILLLTTLVLPATLHGCTLPIFDLTMLATVILILTTLGKIAFQQRTLIPITIFVGCSVLAATSLNDLLYAWHIIDTFWMSKYGLVFFISTHALVIAYRNQSIRNDNELLVLLDERKTHFFRSVSHELRTPLTLLLGPLENLAKQSPNDTSLNLALRNGRKLLQLVNQLLDFHKLSQKEKAVSLQPVQLELFTKSILSQFLPAFEDKDIQLSLNGHPAQYPTIQTKSPAPIILADVDFLDKSITNLVSNALKFTSCGGSVDLRIEQVYIHGKQCFKFTISDTGCGISTEDQERLFQLFSRVGENSNQIIGTGLGLALVKEWVTAMNGEVGVESEISKGSNFWFILPKAQKASLVDLITQPLLESAPTPISTPPHELQSPDHSHIQNIAGPNILVVDDTPDMHRFLHTVLKGHGYRVTSASNGQEALNQIKLKQPQLIISDWMMPGMHGPKLIQLLKENPNTTTIPTLMLTARSDAQSRAQSAESGADAFLGKPFEVRELLAIIRNLLALKSKEHELSNTLQNLQNTQEKLEAQARMAALGNLITGVTHEIGNPLNIMRNGLSELNLRFEFLIAELQAPQKKIPPNADVFNETQNLLQLVTEATSRVDRIVMDLRAYTKQKSDSEYFHLRNSVSTTLNLFGRNFAEENIKIGVSIPTSLKIKFPRGKFDQVLTNLLLNSQEAMPEGGKIEISTKTMNRSIELHIIDSGPGIPFEIKDEIFDPFFSTKNLSKSTGLGLAISREIMLQHGGNLSILPCETGAHFSIGFPTMAQPI